MNEGIAALALRLVLLIVTEYSAHQKHERDDEKRDSAPQKQEPGID